MTIDIKRTVLRTQLTRFILAIIFTISVVTVLIHKVFRNEILGLDREQWALILVFIYIVIAAIDFIREPYYIYFKDDGSKIILRYFSLGFFNKQKNAIEIPKQDFRGFEKKKYLLGLKEKIILSQKIRGKIAKYPAVSITSLNRKEKEKILASLEKYTK